MEETRYPNRSIPMEAREEEKHKERMKFLHGHKDRVGLTHAHKAAEALKSEHEMEHWGKDI